MQETAPLAITRLRTLWVIGHKVTPIPVGDRIVALDVATPVGTPGPPPHYHEDSSEFFYVVAGRLGVMAAGEDQIKHVIVVRQRLHLSDLELGGGQPQASELDQRL